MPTGYTEKILKGFTFQQFTMNCARAFGACVTMRDDPSSVPIPEEFKPTDYHINRLAEVETEITRLSNMTLEEAETTATQEFEKELVRIEKSITENRNNIQQYRNMLQQVESWIPPTEEHVGLKNFMIEQIQVSIEHDDMERFYQDHPTIRLSGQEWLIKKRSRATEDKEYHTKQNQEEIDRVEEGNQWLRDLRASLDYSLA